MKSTIVEATRSHIEQLMSDAESKHLYFHDAEQAKRIAANTLEIAQAADLTKHDQEQVLLAAWFHTAGYVFDYNDPVSGAKGQAKLFLDQQEYPVDRTHEVLNLLDSLTPFVEAKTELEKILIDGTSVYSASQSFPERALEWQKEWNRHAYAVSDLEWARICQDKLTKHSFQTPYATETYSAGLEGNKEWFGKVIKRLTKKRDTALEKELHVNAGELKELKKKLSKISDRPERGVETLFRLGSKNMYTRASLSDTKSNIMISINALILSVMLGTVYGNLDQDPHLIYPVVTMLVVNLVSITFAVLATRPSIRRQNYTREDVEKQQATLMTFDDFQHMGKADFEWAIDKIMNNADYLYLNIARDTYDMGQKLAKKYRYLYLSYNIFLLGIILSVVLFVACHILFGGEIG